jgi:hypothetical protein
MIYIEIFFVNDWLRSDDFSMNLSSVYNILSLDKQISNNKVSDNIEGYVR